MTWIGAQPATAENFRRLLNLGSVGLVPGGIAEMFMSEADREEIKLRDRKGFVRIAVEMGADLVPCYHFGNSRLFGWGPKSLEPLARRHRVALGFLKGRWGLPLPLPERVPLMMVVGGPVAVKQTHPSDQGFAAAVDDAHARLVEAMQVLYDKYKAEYGWADRPLLIK
ncbi:diacylglycerol acyltransferase [Scenedesmus sp. NREL 46B-D3]|nr:diacylglycerol acyltransferase [Scenedesmus sp. NREL 46B-D3]